MMSKFGKLLLTMCDNDMVIDLDVVIAEHGNLAYLRNHLKVTAIYLGLTIKGGS
jgi:hypothetical protein